MGIGGGIGVGYLNGVNPGKVVGVGPEMDRSCEAGIGLWGGRQVEAAVGRVAMV